MARFVRFQNQDEPGLYLVHPENETSPCDVEIVFVHGLMGKPTTTWRHPETGCVFFRDLLPQQMLEQLPQCRARIWSYGYPADIGFSTSQVYDFALSLLQEMKDVRRGCEERKIVWVCHSLGGIVVKKALNEACGQVQYTDIFKNTAGIAFLGTPHQGSGTATFGQITSGIAGAFVPGAQMFNRVLLRNLEKNSPTLFEISNRFAAICSQFRIFSFYESRPLMGRVVVTRSSAVLNLPNETASPLNADHRSICRYKDRSDQNWRPVLNSILDMVSVTRQSLRPTPAPGSRLSGPGNQRQPQPPYPRHSLYQQHHGNSHPHMQSHPRPQNQTFYSHPPPSTATNGGREGDAFAGMEAQWAAHLPEIPRRPVPSPESFTHTQPPRPPKVPLSGVTSTPSASTAASGRGRSPVPPGSQPSGTYLADRRERTPYPSFNPAYSRENISTLSAASTSTSSLGQKTTTPQTHENVPPSTAPQEESVEDERGSTTVSAMCDACLNNISCSQPRAQCSECYDYDLCSSCYRGGRVSKSHKSNHVMRHIVKTVVLNPQDYIPPHDEVNPEKSPDGLKTYITLEPDVNQNGSEARWHHLHGANSHLRYLTATTEPGHYAAHITIQPRLSPLLSQAAKNELKQNGLGYVRIGLGTLKNKKQFFRTRYREESFDSVRLAEGEIINKLLEDYWWTVIKLPGDGEPVHVHADTVFPVEKPQDLGLIIQWSGIRAFESNNNAVVAINIASMLLYDILDFAESLPVPPSKPVDTPTQPPQNTASSPAAQEEDDDDDDDDTITAQDFISTLVQIQQSVEDARQRAEFEKAIKQRLQQQEEEKRREVMALLFARALQERARLEQERQEQEEARRFLRLMGYNV